MMARILVIEENEAWRAFFAKHFRTGHEVEFCENHRTASRRLKTESFDVIVYDLDPKVSNEMTFVERVRDLVPRTPVIVTCGTEKAEVIVRVMKAGIFDFIPKPYTVEKVRLSIDNALEKMSLHHEIDYLRRQQDVIYDFERIIAVSPVMKNVMETIRKLARTDSTVLMTGETGTGKSFLSGTVHFNSARRDKAFVTINCANIPETLLESELFGHEMGAFTGAQKARVGRLEQANGGTVFLDEIGELSPALQAKLLRVLEEKAFERLGGNRTIHSNIRIIAATNRNLEELIREGAFREDLYYRINVLRIHLPPVRDRLECIEPIAQHLLKKVCRTVKKHVEGFSPGVLDTFRSYTWPGNIREMSNVIERAVLLEETPTVRMENVSLPEIHRAREIRPAPEPPRPEVQHLDEQEKTLILDALEKSLWIQKDAAALLGVTPRVLHYKIKKYGITHSRWYKNK